MNHKIKKSLFSLCSSILASIFACTLSLTALTGSAAASGSCADSTRRADQLASLHLFQGTADGYQLDRAPTRMQGLVMLIRLLGLEQEALDYSGDAPFTDLTWGQSYAAYAYANGLTRGTSATTFQPDGKLTARNYITFLLRALGYQDNQDFDQNTQLSFAADISLITRDAAQKLASVTLNRGDMTDLSYAALTCRFHQSQITLAEKLRDAGVFTDAEGQAAGVLNQNHWTYQYIPHDNSTVIYNKQSISTSAGSITAHVLTVNTQNPNVSVKSMMANQTDGATAPFSSLVQKSGALAAINGNFFESYQADKTPIGYVMSDGALLYGDAGLSSLIIDKNGAVRISRPSLYARISTSDQAGDWTVYTVNTKSQSGTILYTPAFGKSISIQTSGQVLIASNQAIAGIQSVSPGDSIAIPVNGFVLYLDSGDSSALSGLSIGTAITLEYNLRDQTGEISATEQQINLVSGAPRLVEDGAIATKLEAGFDEARFTTASAPRTAVGINQAGKLLMVSVPKATIQQMREAMLSLGCTDAFNLDGGASSAMYYNQKELVKAGRDLTVTLQVFVKS